MINRHTYEHLGHPVGKLQNVGKLIRISFIGSLCKRSLVDQSVALKPQNYTHLTSPLKIKF